MSNIDRNEITVFLKNRLAELLNVNADNINDDAYFVEELGTTSIMIVDLFVSVEDEYGVDMQSRFDLTDKLSVNILADMILSLMEAE